MPRCFPTRRTVRVRPILLGAGIGVLALALVAPTGAQAVPPAARDLGAGIERLASYQGQTVCDPTEKPGVVAFRAMVHKQYGGTSAGIARACEVGGKSEHKEGRAWDWPLRADRPADAAKADELLRWLLAGDCYGNKHAMARRLGIMYVIWNRQVWSAYAADRGWQPYSGTSPHTDHVHFSFSWDGANKSTSYWTFDPVAGGTCLEVVATKAQADKYVTSLYGDFLGRTADPGGLFHWSKLVSSGDMSTHQVAYAMATTDEWLSQVLAEMYSETLGRDPDPDGLAFWRAQIRGGMPVAEVASRFYASDEYFVRRGSDVKTWVGDLYRALLERAPDPEGMAHWTAQTGKVGRVAVALAFYQSQETLERRVHALYASLLGRTADQAGLATWPPLVADRGDLVLAAFLASSGEYWARAQSAA